MAISEDFAVATGSLTPRVEDDPGPREIATALPTVATCSGLDARAS